MKKKIYFIFCLFLLIFTSGTLAEENQAEIYLKSVLKQLHLTESFQGEILTRINMNDKILTYRTGVLKDGSRSDVSTMHTFWQLKGTDIGRTIRSVPWFYLPPDFSLVQYALPIQRRSSIEEPLLRVGYDYDVKILREDKERTVFELSNGYIIQEVVLDRLKNVIVEIQVMNSMRKVLAVIEYVNWKEYFTGVLLPESIRLTGEEEQLILEMVYLNWKVNQGIDDFAKTLPSSWTKAVDNLKNNILQNPGDDKLHYQLAMLYKEQSYWTNAIEELDKALALNPKVEYREEMAKIYDALGQYEDAINQLLVVLEKGESAARYYLLGNLYEKINNPMLAQAAYEHAVAMDANKFMYWERLFWNYRNVSINDERMMKRAIQVCEKLLEMQPEHYQYRIYLGDLYIENNDYDRAVEQYKMAEAVAPDQSLPLIKIARYYEKTGDISKALSALQDAVKIDEQWWNYLQLGDFYLRQARIEDALIAYEQSLQLNPRNTDLNIKLGKVLWQLGREDDAKKYWYQALQFEEANIYTYIKVGEILLQYNLVKEAEEIFMRAIERFQMLGDQSLQPGLSQIYEKVGLLYLDKDPVYAMECFEKAYKYQPGSSSCLYLGLKEMKLGNLNKAISYWTEANLLDGDNLKAYIYLTVVKGLRGEVLDSQSKELGPIELYLSIEERELMSRFFGYFSVIRTIKNESENTSEEARLAFEESMTAFMKGDLNLATEHLKKSIQKDKHYRKGHFFSGIIYSLMDQQEKAQEHFAIVQDYYGGSNAARISGNIVQSIKRLFWKTKII